MTRTSKAAAWCRRNKRSILILTVAVAAVATAATLKSHGPDADSASKLVPTLEFTPSEVIHVEALALGQNLFVTGSLDAVQKITLRAKVAAEVRSIPVREGDRVAAGQLVAQIDSVDAQARLAERVGTLETARANLALSEKNRATNKDLLAQSYISQNAYDAIESGYQANAGQVQAAQANVDIARNALSDARVIAPISGVVSKRHVQPGEKVNFDAALISIVDLRTLELQALVPASEVPRIRVGATARLKVDGFADRTFDGRVDRIAPATEPGTRAVLVLITVANPGEQLKVGMFASGAIAIDQTAPVPTLPTDAVRTEGDTSHVWIIAEGKLQKRVVRIGRRDDGGKRVEIEKGVSPSDVILAARFDRLREGAPARVIATDAPASAAPKSAS